MTLSGHGLCGQGHHRRARSLPLVVSSFCGFGPPASGHAKEAPLKHGFPRLVLPLRSREGLASSMRPQALEPTGRSQLLHEAVQGLQSTGHGLIPARTGDTGMSRCCHNTVHPSMLVHHREVSFPASRATEGHRGPAARVLGSSFCFASPLPAEG